MGGVLSVATRPVRYTLMVYDPKGRTSDYGLRGVFRTGISAQASATWSGRAADRPTTMGVSVTGTTADGEDLSEVMLPPDLRGGDRDGSWRVAVQGSHLLIASRTRPGKGLGLYVKGALSDGNPNVIRASVVGGVTGHGLMEARPDDSVGVGFYANAFSDALQSAVTPLVRFGDEQGIEMFYSIALRRWLRVAADVQVVNPARADVRLAVVGGVRMTVVF